MAERERIGRASAKSLNVTGYTLQGLGVPKVAKVSFVGGTDTAGGVFAWLNPEAGAILVHRVVLDVTTVAAGAGTVSVGKATNATTSAANLIDTLDVRSATGVFDNLQNPGSGGKPVQKLAAGNFVTCSKASGATAGLVGTAYITYVIG